MRPPDFMSGSLNFDLRRALHLLVAVLIGARVEVQLE